MTDLLKTDIPAQLQLPFPSGKYPPPLNEHSVKQLRNSKLRVALAIVVTEDDDDRQVLLVKRAEPSVDGCPRWVFPGGKIERGENASAAAKRELLEEAGLWAVPYCVLGNRVHPLSGAKTFYVVLNSPREATPPQDEKIEECRWVSVESLEDYVGDSLYSKVWSFLQVGQKRLSLA